MAESFDLLTLGLVSLFSLNGMLLLLGGVLIGVIVGAVPGLSPITALACLMPITFGMTPGEAVMLFVAIYVGSNFGNSIPSILIGLPGTPSAVLTALEGYKLTQKGRGPETLMVALYSSVAGQLIGGLVVAFLLVPVASIAVRFLFPEIFAIAVLALVATASIVSGNVLLGLMSAILGLIIQTVGIDPVTGRGRFDFGDPFLRAGLNQAAIIIGFLVVGEILHQLLNSRSERSMDEEKPKTSYRDVFNLPILLALKTFAQTWRASLMGTLTGGLFIGMLPGVGGSIGAFVAYQQSRLVAREPEKYGTGSMEAVAALDSAGNADTATSAVPTFAFGIPGSPVMVLLLAALVIHGITPGPGLMQSEPASVSALLATLIAAPAALLIVGFLFLPVGLSVVRLPKNPIRVVALVISIIGIYSLQWSLFDVGLLIGIGLLSLGMRLINMPVLPATLGVVLGPILETNLRVGTTMTGSLAEFFLRPGVVTILSIALISALLPGLMAWIKRHRRKAAHA